MIPFFSRTGTRKTLDGARDNGWGILVSATGVWRDEGFTLVGADNGQWSERDIPGPFKEERFLRYLEWLDDRAHWLVLPDIVCGGLESLDLTLCWLDRLRGHPSILLIAVQNGMTPPMIAPFLGPRVGLFVGGDTEWKESSLRMWGQLAEDTGCYLHVGRVNSERRIWLSAGAGAKSFDGTSASRFSKTIPLIERASRQPDLEPYCRQASNKSPEGFARRCREINAMMSGHAKHRAFDAACEEALKAAGYGEGVAIFEDGVRAWHAETHAYPYPLQCPDCENPN